MSEDSGQIRWYHGESTISLNGHCLRISASICQSNERNQRKEAEDKTATTHRPLLLELRTCHGLVHAHSCSVLALTTKASLCCPWYHKTKRTVHRAAGMEHGKETYKIRQGFLWRYGRPEYVTARAALSSASLCATGSRHRMGGSIFLVLCI